MEENKKHIVYVPIEELEFFRYMDLLADYGFTKCNLTKSDSKGFKELASIFAETLKKID